MQRSGAFKRNEHANRMTLMFSLLFIDGGISSLPGQACKQANVTACVSQPAGPGRWHACLLGCAVDQAAFFRTSSSCLQAHRSWNLGMSRSKQQQAVQAMGKPRDNFSHLAVVAVDIPLLGQGPVKIWTLKPDSTYRRPVSSGQTPFCF